MGWLSFADVRLKVHPRKYTALVKYSDWPDEQRYPFVIAPTESNSSQYPLFRSACNYAAIRTLFQIASFTNITSRVCRTMKEDKASSSLPTPPRLWRCRGGRGWLRLR
jgi:hypothetical protein